MEEAASDEEIEVSRKGFRKVAESLEKSGYVEGVTDGRDSIFQQSFDKGYEDGFKMGYRLGLKQEHKSSRGKCLICSDSSLIKRSESEVRELHLQTFEQS